MGENRYIWLKNIRSLFTSGTYLRKVLVMVSKVSADISHRVVVVEAQAPPLVLALVLVLLFVFELESLSEELVSKPLKVNFCCCCLTAITFDITLVVDFRFRFFFLVLPASDFLGVAPSGLVLLLLLLSSSLFVKDTCRGNSEDSKRK